ncbi:MAG: 4-carboxy-4-hydroxy-2-oxoadipate aldolase/oxaloacetate decarboxylase [Actinomycetota bacterium]|jgi:4-hydroxy-4-methyl-2-oxoglutarate aldolase|nr:4-carboxy-4-hydroxy-2-oxoadipate aldolase/oxaloacetate decarboxylase [Actinomycetota bacterium]HWS80699.1 4-carboxy-4-hydroxy-2-oxoadipate aldolase/oxaloacetate decarboxylase [Rubrobacter sp.]
MRSRERAKASRLLADFGTATVCEAAGGEGIVDVDLKQVVPGSRVAGPARTVLCGQGDNLAVHEALAAVRPGEVLVITMPEPAPFGAVGELIVIQARACGAAGMLVDVAVRDVAELKEIGLPIWARFVRVRGTSKTDPGRLDVPVVVGGATIRPGDVVVMDDDGAVVVPAERVEEVSEGARAREDKESRLRPKLRAGELTYDLLGLRAKRGDGG